MQTIDIGDTATVYCWFRAAPVPEEPPSTTVTPGALTDPSTVTVTVTSPTGAVTSVTSPHATLGNPSVGVWTWTDTSQILAAAGVWHVRWNGTAGLRAEAVTTVKVRARP
jgi:hypothetical protein